MSNSDQNMQRNLALFELSRAEVAGFSSDFVVIFFIFSRSRRSRHGFLTPDAQYKESLTVCATDKGPGRGKVALSCSKC